MQEPVQAIHAHQQALRGCRRCPAMQGPVVVGTPVLSPILLVGQAPGDREVAQGRPFAWTAGRTLFDWFRSIGLEEARFRKRIYMAAVCRCFPGKLPKGGDRVPSRTEIAQCRDWLRAEVRLLQPRLILPVGRLAIGQFIEAGRLDQVVGRRLRVQVEDLSTDLIPLPHPSGASVWHRTAPGKALLAAALDLVRTHPAWQTVLAAPQPVWRGL